MALICFCIMALGVPVCGYALVQTIITDPPRKALRIFVTILTLFTLICDGICYGAGVFRWNSLKLMRRIDVRIPAGLLLSAETIVYSVIVQKSKYDSRTIRKHTACVDGDAWPPPPSQDNR